MSTSKTIENPEVPGLECLLPPPPPPLAPPASLSKDETVNIITQMKCEKSSEDDLQSGENSATTSGVVLVPSESPVRGNSPYFIHPAIQAQNAIPWWIPNEADSSEIYDPQYAQWHEITYKVPTAANTSSKTKSKYYKRKSECIDPAQDAEKVANAQKELSNLMKPLQCDLCNAVMNSTPQAKLHYEGKPHQKKVSMFLNQSVKKLKTEDNGQVSSTTEADWNTYCEVCKTWFTSQTDATQHYAGKKHLRATNGGARIRPAKKHQNQNSQIDLTGRYGIGLAFQPDPSPPVTDTSIIGTDLTSVPVPPVPIAINFYTPQPFPTPLRCDLCGISTNRQDQLDTHRRGAKHLRMRRMNGLPVPDPASEPENVVAACGPIDYSIYRTPSGQYYCAPCNVSLNSESSFAQHVESKKHRNQMYPKTASSGSTSAKKTKLKKK